MTTYRISQYNHEVGNLVLSTLSGLVPLVATFIVIHTFYGRLLEKGYTLSGILTSLLPFIILILILVIPRILYGWYILSYKVVIRDGEIVETQLFNSPRRVNVSQIEKMKWSYSGAILELLH